MSGTATSTTSPEDIQASAGENEFQEGVNLQEDLKWFLAHLQEISQQLGEQWVAVRGKQIIAHGDSVKIVREEMQRQGVKRAVLTRTGLGSWDLVR